MKWQLIGILFAVILLLCVFCTLGCSQSEDADLLEDGFAYTSQQTIKTSAPDIDFSNESIQDIALFYSLTSDLIEAQKHINRTYHEIFDVYDSLGGYSGKNRYDSKWETEFEKLLESCQFEMSDLNFDRQAICEEIYCGYYSFNNCWEQYARVLCIGFEAASDALQELDNIRSAMGFSGGKSNYVDEVIEHLKIYKDYYKILDLCIDEMYNLCEYYEDFISAKIK